jgi:hypothetical protein
MKKLFQYSLALVALAGLGWSMQRMATPPAAFAKEKDQSKDVNGKVLSKADAPIKGAVVYLKNTKTLAVKSYISDDAGAFHFHALSPNVDYEVYAEFNGQRSGTKTVSSFDSRTTVEMTLKVDTK